MSRCPICRAASSASQDQIDWVLTSYIVAAAIMTPPTGFLAGRFGLKRLFLVSVIGFTLASMLCGMAQIADADRAVPRAAGRVRRGAWCRCRSRCCSTIYPQERQGFAMALFGIGVMVGPVLGPVLGGWLTENYSWRYVFYINLPIGILGLIGMMRVPAGLAAATGRQARLVRLRHAEPGASARCRSCSTAASIKDWFSSGEIIIEADRRGLGASICSSSTSSRRENPFVEPSMFRDRNFAAGMLFVVIIGLTYYASMALQPPYLQELMNYPVVTAGLIMGPRGVGTMASMLIVGRLVGRVDTRTLLAIGLGADRVVILPNDRLDAGYFAGERLSRSRMVQGFGLGFLFVPLERGDVVDAAGRSSGPKAPASTACSAMSARASAFRW